MMFLPGHSFFPEGSLPLRWAQQMGASWLAKASSGQTAGFHDHQRNGGAGKAAIDLQERAMLHFFCAPVFIGHSDQGDGFGQIGGRRSSMTVGRHSVA